MSVICREVEGSARAKKVGHGPAKISASVLHSYLYLQLRQVVDPKLDLKKAPKLPNPKKKRSTSYIDDNNEASNTPRYPKQI